MIPSPSLIAPSPLAARLGGRLGTALLLLVLAAMYGTTLGFPLQFLDDESYILRNPLLADGRLQGAWKVWTGTHYGYTPITHLTYWFDLFCRDAGITGWWLARTHQLLWIALGVLGVRRLMHLITGCPVTAWCVALLFALHPVCVSTVLWLALRRNAVAFAFSMWAVVWYLQALDRTTSRARLGCCLAVLLLTTCACLARFSAISILVLAPLLSLLRPGAILRSQLAPLACVAIPIIAMVAYLVACPDPKAVTGLRLGDTLGGTLWLDGEILLRYAWHVIAPWNLAPYYGVTESGAMSWRQGACWLALAGIIATTITVVKDRREAVILWLAAAVMIGPTLNLITQVIAMSDHYLQPALPFLLLLLVRIAQRVWDRCRTVAHRAWPALACTLVALYLAAGTWAAAQAYASQPSLALQLVRASPASGLMLSYAVAVLESSPDPRHQQAIHDLAPRALVAEDRFRATDACLFRCLFIATSDLGQTGRWPEAHHLLDLQAENLGPSASAIIRSRVLDSAGSPDEALGVLQGVSPVAETELAALWLAHLDAAGPSAMDGDAAFAAAQAYASAYLPHHDQLDIWQERLLYELARLCARHGDPAHAARYALAGVAINPLTTPNWQLLADGYRALGLEGLADTARSRMHNKPVQTTAR